MDKDCPVATFVRRQLDSTSKLQCEVAREAGFDNPNIITMIKQGRTKLPLSKVGRMAKALDTDALSLMKLCMRTYHGDAWQFVEPLLERALTEDEALLLRAWRQLGGAPGFTALTDESRALLRSVLQSVSTTPVSQ